MKRYRKPCSITVSAKDFGVNEECGIFGIISKNEEAVAQDVYYGLFALQHRGQESAGMAVAYVNGKIAYYKNMGLVSEVFGHDELTLLPKSRVGIGHVRYSTAGSSNVVNAQPVVFHGRKGRVAMAINGCIVNAEEIRNRMIAEGHMFQSSVDSEVIAAWFNFCCQGEFEEGLATACRELKGSYAMVVMCNEKLYAVRDPYALKPLIMGEKDGRVIFASESCALDAIDADIVRDVTPGEIITVDVNGAVCSRIFDKKAPKPCIFEYVYMARSDSVIDEQSVYASRYKCGAALAKLVKIDADVVAGVPDSALVSARGYSEISGIPYVDAISKNRYIGRTFIQPEQAMRENSVKIKLNAFRSNIKGKRLILIDDSIVRGTTSKKIIQLLRQSGATEVHMIVASPAVTCPCFFGVDMQTKDQLVAANNSTEEICKLIGADSLHYIPLEQLVDACSVDCRHNEFCTGCFDGKYAFDVEKYNCDK